MLTPKQLKDISCAQALLFLTLDFVQIKFYFFGLVLLNWGCFAIMATNAW